MLNRNTLWSLANLLDWLIVALISYSIDWLIESVYFRFIVIGTTLIPIYTELCAQSTPYTIRNERSRRPSHCGKMRHTRGLYIWEHLHEISTTKTSSRIRARSTRRTSVRQCGRNRTVSQAGNSTISQYECRFFCVKRTDGKRMKEKTTILSTDEKFYVRLTFNLNFDVFCASRIVRDTRVSRCRILPDSTAVSLRLAIVSLMTSVLTSRIPWRYFV